MNKMDNKNRNVGIKVLTKNHSKIMEIYLKKIIIISILVIKEIKMEMGNNK
jgi:hypothetical protein